MLVGHLKWEDDYKQLYEEIKASAEAEAESAEGEGEQGRDKEADKQKQGELTEMIKQSIRNIVRFFHENRTEFDKLKDLIGHKKSSKIHEFVTYYANQHDIFKHKMTTSKEEEDSKAEQLKQLEEKVKS